MANLTISHLKYPVLNWETVSCNKSFTITDILENPHLPWKWRGVTRNPNVTAEYIEQHPELPWDMSVISLNPNVKNSCVPQRKNDETDNHYYYRLSYNKHLTLDMVLSNLDAPWDWGHIAENSFDSEIIRLEPQLERRRRQFAKQFYWNLVKAMSKPPLGYYFLNDLETHLPECKKVTLRQIRSNRASMTADKIQQLLL
jgi:hypothetical protein